MYQSRRSLNGDSSPISDFIITQQKCLVATICGAFLFFMELSKVGILHQPLQINSIGQFVTLTKGQKGLLALVRSCVEQNLVFSWDELVLCYYNNVRKEVEDWRWVSLDVKDREREYYLYDIMESYKAQDWHWKYKIRGAIKGWFVSTLGVLVIKNQLLVLPTISIEN